jgi:hypothetical protein
MEKRSETKGREAQTSAEDGLTRSTQGQKQKLNWKKIFVLMVFFLKLLRGERGEKGGLDGPILSSILKKNFLLQINTALQLALIGLCTAWPLLVPGDTSATATITTTTSPTPTPAAADTATTATTATETAADAKTSSTVAATAAAANAAARVGAGLLGLGLGVDLASAMQVLQYVF